MELSLLQAAPLAVQIHVAAVVPAFVAGTWMMFVSRKGSREHRAVGKTFLLLMSLAAASATFIRAPESQGMDLGPLRIGFIHLFVPLVAWGVFAAGFYVRRGNIAGHKRAMRGLYFGGLLLAGVLAFVPPRLMWQMFIR